jgi:hypothetical protein
MTSGIYTAALSAFLSGDIDLLNDPISAMLVTTEEYTVDFDHESQSDVPNAAVLSIVSLSNPTIIDGVFRADDLVFSGVAASDEITGDAIILFVNASTLSGSHLIAYLDNAPEFPVTLDGEDITVVWDTGSDGIFGLG